MDPQSTLDRPFDISEQLWDFACVSRPVRGTAFLVWQGKWRLTYGKVNTKIKEASGTRRIWRRQWLRDTLDQDRRSVSVGKRGSTGPHHPVQGQMEVAGLAYIRLSTGADNAAVSVLCNLKSLTRRDVRKMMPGAN